MIPTARFAASLILTLCFIAGAQPMMDFVNPAQDVKITNVKVEGNRTVDDGVILNSVSIQEGETYLPPELNQKIKASIKKLESLELFSKISVKSDRSNISNEVELTIHVEELPTLASIEFKGNKKLDDEDLREVVDLIDGMVYGPYHIEETKQNILEKYREKGYLLARIEVEIKEEEATARDILVFQIDEGKKVEVEEIRITGNKEIEDKDLKKQMETKEDRWWRSGDFKEDEFLGSLDSIEQYYQEKGFLDARVKDHEITYSDNKEDMYIDIEVYEGPQYYMGNAVFIHNDILNDKQLQVNLALDEGEVFNMKKYRASVGAIQQAYLEEGYLNINIDDPRVYRDSLVDVTFEINEGGLAHIHKVMIRGNDKTWDKVIRREVKLFPGDVFRLSLLQRSARDIMQLAYFDNVVPNFEMAGTDDPSDVNLVFDVTEKSAGTGTFSAGAAYSQRDQFVGTLGLQIPNLLGRGQRLDMNIEAGGLRQYYSFAFTEPWLMDTPTLIRGSIFYNRQEPVVSGETRFLRYGFRGTLGRRLQWPDDYFTVSSTYNLTLNDNGRSRDPQFLVIESGMESSLFLTLTRDDKNLPVFPTEGSKYSWTVGRVGGPLLQGNFDYWEYLFEVSHWFPVYKKFALELNTEFGMLNGENIQSYSLYQMGGLLGYRGQLRGYSPGSIGRNKIGRSYLSFVAELQYPVVDQVFYLISFFDAGNVFGQLRYDPNNPTVRSDKAPPPWEEIDLTNLKKDFGFGFRLNIPMMGILGFDFGFPLDTENTNESFWGQMQPNFVIEAPF